MACSLHYVTLDVFTTSRFKGNPLAVVFLASDLPLTQDQKQTVAREFNYSETIFVHPVDDTRTRRVDIFTTDEELPFAGHPTIGAAAWLLLHPTEGHAVEAAPSIICTKAGEIPISRSEQDLNMVSALIPHNVRIHSSRMPLAKLLQMFPILKPHLNTKICADGFPVVSIVNGMSAVHVELPNSEALAAVTTAAGGESVSTVYLDDGWEGHISTYFFVRDVWDETLQKKVLRSRMILGTLEDAATGSAASGLVSYLTLTAPERESKREFPYHVVQGVEMGKRSDIGLKVVLKEDGEAIESVELSGSAVKVAEGDIYID